MAGPMKWRSRQVARELENYRTRVAAERASQEADTDQDADAIRLGAPEIVPVVPAATPCIAVSVASIRRLLVVRAR